MEKYSDALKKRLDQLYNEANKANEETTANSVFVQELHWITMACYQSALDTAKCLGYSVMVLNGEHKIISDRFV